LNGCLSGELIARYVSDECSARQRNQVESHAACCEVCRREIQASRENETFLHRMAKVLRDGHSFVELGTIVEENEVSQVLKGAIEGYEILEEIHRGGQGVVYKAVQKSTKRVIALKVLLRGPHASSRERYRFEREVDLVANLRHPNIVTVYDSGITQGQYYFAMEYIQGERLDVHIRSKEMSLAETMALFGKICAAVAYAHQHGVIHRDLKPSNILIDADNEPHILDFGLAKLSSASDSSYREDAWVSLTGLPIGTLAFMSPEQASGSPDSIDVRTDVYSLGVVFYRILTGMFPYDVEGSALQSLQNIENAEPIRPRHVIRSFDADVEAILLKSLEKDPNGRYQSAAELHRDIQSWLEGLPILARSVSSVYLLRKLISRHRYTSGVAALLMVIVAGFGAVSFELYRSAAAARDRSDRLREKLVQEAADNFVFSQQVAFSFFLRAWQEGRDKQAIPTGRFFSPSSREAAAARFLLNPKPLAEKEAALREDLGEQHRSFAQFVIAEHYLKDGALAEAVESYRRSLKYMNDAAASETRADRWLMMHIEGRLSQLCPNEVGTDTLPLSGCRR